MPKQTEPLTEAEEIRRGNMLAEALHLKRDKTYPDRWLTDWGNKTSLGLFRTVKRMVEEGE